MNLRKPSSKDIHYFFTYGISCISLGLGFAAIGPLLPYLAESVNVSYAQISFLFTAHSLGYLVGSSAGGRLYDHYNGHRIMMIALGMMVVTAILIPLTPVFCLLLAVMVLFGLGQGALDVGANVNLLWVYQSRVGPYMNGLHFFFGVGAFLSPIIVHNIMRMAGGALTWPFWSLAILFLPGLFGLFALKSPVNPEEEKEGNKHQPINTWLVGLMMLLFFIYVGVEGGFGGWIFTYATETNITSESAAAYLNSIFWGALTLGRLISVPLAKKIAPSRLLIGNFLLSVVFLSVILVWPTDEVMIWIGAAGLGMALSSVFPTLLALSETRMKITGGVTGLFFLGSSLGGTFIPMMLGQVFEYIGTYQIMLTLFGFALLGFVVLLAVILASNRAGEKVRT